MLAATAAADPEDDPPGVRERSKRFLVGPGWAPPSSAVTVFPIIMHPAYLNAQTQALSFPGAYPLYASQPILCGHIKRF